MHCLPVVQRFFSVNVVSRHQPKHTILPRGDGFWKSGLTLPDEHQENNLKFPKHRQIKKD